VGSTNRGPWRMGAVASVIAALGVLATGCGTPAAAPASVPVSGDATPTPSRSAAPSRTPVPSPSPASPADLAVAGLVALAANPETTYQVALNGRSRHSADILPVEGTLEVAGGDSQLVADFVFPDAGGESRVEVRVIDGDGWVQYEGDPFTEVGELGDEEAPNPLAQIDDATDVTIVAREPDADGHYQVELDGMVIHPVFIPAVNLSETEVNRTELILLIDARGRPVSGTWEMVGQGRVSRQLQEIVIELDLRFDGLGRDIVIERP
jgi:hypothetical protein